MHPEAFYQRFFRHHDPLYGDVLGTPPKAVLVLITDASAHHPQLGIIHQCLGQSAKVVRGPDQLWLVFHQAIQGHIPCIPHQLRCLFPRALARDTGFNAKEGMGLVFTLVEGGFADGEFGFFCGHWSISPKSLVPGLAARRQASSYKCCIGFTICDMAQIHVEARLAGVWVPGRHIN